MRPVEFDKEAVGRRPALGAGPLLALAHFASESKTATFHWAPPFWRYWVLRKRFQLWT